MPASSAFSPIFVLEDDDDDEKEEGKGRFTFTLKYNIYSAAINSFDAMRRIHGKVILVDDVAVGVVQQVE